MPYGVTGGPAIFQTVMNVILESLLRKCVVVFIDDILIYNRYRPKHLQHVNEVLTILQKHQFHVKMSKCAFAKKQLTYLGPLTLPKLQLSRTGLHHRTLRI